LFIGLFMLSYHWNYRKRRGFNLVLMISFVLLMGFSFQVQNSREETTKELEMHVFSVEHGLSILIRWPNGENWLYDCGQMGSPMVADKIVIPALNSMGVRQIDKLLISHADSDHFNGIPALLDSEIKIKSILTTPHFIRSRQPDAIALKERIFEKRIAFQSVIAGDILFEHDGATAQVLHPAADFAQFKADNSTSLVIEMQSHGINCILTGDLEGQGLGEMVEYRESQKNVGAGCHVMVAPHHGGIQSNPEWFYQTFQPEIVITSQGRGRFGLASSLESQLKAFSPDARLYVTARDGAIEIKWAKNGLKTSTYRHRKSADKPAGRAEPLKGRDTWSAE
ncbi:MAG: ComEC/Rec2 family competence protein, partial [bacterium]